MEHKAAVTVAAFALGAGEGVLLAGVRMQKHGEVVAHRFETLVHQLLRRGADHYPVSFLDRQPEQLIAHGTAYQINVHVVVTNPLTQNDYIEAAALLSPRLFCFWNLDPGRWAP